jgi:hypothetical protein
MMSNNGTDIKFSVDEFIQTIFDGEDFFFGLVIGLEIEFGYFSLSELQSVKGPLGLPIERDLHFEPKSLRELRDYHKEERGGR